MVSSASISQALGNPSQQTITFFISLRPLWKASIGANMNSGLPRCRERFGQCLAQCTQVQTLPS